MFNFQNSYIQLPKDFFSETFPTPVSKPQLVVFNKELSEALSLSKKDFNESDLASFFSGNQLLKNSQPIAQAYSGHQFGYFTMLGDGRAHLLGEHVNPSGKRFDIQLKGSGPTPYSRGGDGRATLKSMLREYLISEAMYYLNIPTSRSLAVVKSGELVKRDPVQPGAILTRVMQSHIRVGTFEYAKRFLDNEKLKQLIDYSIERHYPMLKELNYPGLPLLEKVMLKQIDLVVDWMRVGFIHGVMNTDNMSIAGETFDYGPCAFMNTYNPSTVFSSIDSNGRYAFGNQPNIAQWNMSVFAAALLPFMGENEDKAVEQAKAILNSFGAEFSRKWNKMMARKIGFNSPSNITNELCVELLKWMEKKEMDYTQTFYFLTYQDLEGEEFKDQVFIKWKQKWKTALKEQSIDFTKAQEIMKQFNPTFIPRNHIVEEVLNDAEKGNLQPLNSFLDVLKKPFINKKDNPKYFDFPEGFDQGYSTYCGT